MAPWKCPDCGTWWSGLEHRCLPTGVTTGDVAPGVTGPILIDTTGCNCGHIELFPNQIGSGTTVYKPCPIHPAVTHT